MKNVLGKIQQKVHLIVSVLLVVFFLLFLLQNVEETQVSLLLWSVSISRALLLLITLCMGIVIGLLFKAGYRKKQLRSGKEEGV